MTTNAYPLDWPFGWKRTPKDERTRAKFGKASRARAGGGWDFGRPLTIFEAVSRVRAELDRMGVNADELVISANLKLRRDGLPYSDQKEPIDPGAAVYWGVGEDARTVAIDHYDRVADNLAAIAATLDAFRKIERHGGAQILNRAYAGLLALPAPIACAEPWYSVLGVEPDNSHEFIERAYLFERSKSHPDKGGDPAQFDRVQKAWERYLKESGHD